MNIFAVDADPRIAARCLIDRHIVKMPSESCIMLANAYSIEDLRRAPRTKTGALRGHGYPHHGCTRWVKASRQNFDWLVEHSIELCLEFTYRNGKVHFCQEFIEWCSQNNPMLVNCGLTPFFLAMPDEHKSDDPIKSYQSYYRTKKFDKSGKLMYHWGRGRKPAWA